MFNRFKKIKLGKGREAWQKTLRFVKYHNAFTIILAVGLILGGAVLASEDIRQVVIGKILVERQGIDNTALLSADLDSLINEVHIENVTEDDRYYYLTYYFPSMKIIDNIWQKATSTQVLKVAKDALGSQDLGLYAAEEIGEVVEGELAYLKEVKAIEEQKGVTLVKETTTYTALIGLVLNPKTKELPGYAPVIQPEQLEPFVGIAGIDEAANRRAAREQQEKEQDGPVGDETSNREVPETIIVSAPESLTTSTQAIFSFGSTVENSAFQCQVNSQGFMPCDSPKKYVGLTPGDYVFEVYAAAQDGSYDKTPAQFSWTIEEQGQPSPEGGAAEGGLPLDNESEAASTQEQPSEPPADNTTSTPSRPSTSSDITSGAEPPEQTTTSGPVVEPEPEPEPAIEPPSIENSSTTQETASSTE